VLVGGCNGTEVLFSARVSGASAAMSPPTLGPGRYGFAARARDASCHWYAAGCSEVVVPVGGTTTRMLATSETIEPGCSADAGVHDAPSGDGASSDVTRPPCATTFGGISGFVLCTETATTCRFYAITGGHSCNASCTSVGSSCIAEENDDSAGAVCDTLGASTCASNGNDAICTCAR